MQSMKYLAKFVDGSLDSSLPESLKTLFTSEGAAWSKIYQAGLDPKRVDVFPVSSALDAAQLINATEPELPCSPMLGKDTPIVEGLLDYFPNALAAVARHSKFGNDKHNPGQPLHWAFDKSTEHANSAGRHLMQRGTIDPETGKSHSIGLAWRALALLETELLKAGAQKGRAVK